MDAEVVNRTKDPVEISLTIEGVPAGWDINFNSRYPSFPVRSVMVQGRRSNLRTNRPPLSSKPKFRRTQDRALIRSKSRPKIPKAQRQYVETINYRVTSKKIETGGIKVTSQYPVLSTGNRANSKIYRRSQKRNQQAADDFASRSGAAGLDGAFQAAIRRPTDFVDPTQRKRLGNAQRRDRHAGEGGSERVSSHHPGSRRRF